MLLTPSLAFRAAFVTIFAALGATGLQAGAKFTGATGYEILQDGNSVSLQAEVVGNSSAENATGTLMMQLWALEAPYQGGKLNGTLLGSYKLEGLGPGQRYTGIKKAVRMTGPAVRKNYAVCLTLSEYRNGAYSIADYRNTPNPKLLGPSKMFKLEGPWKWQTSYEGGTIDISVAKISHHRTGKTGSLKLSVWATKEPYHGGRLQGFELGSVAKKALDPGFSYTGVQNTEKFSPPPNGNYYVSLILSEFNGKEYVIEDFIPSSKASTFVNPKK